MRPTRIIGMRNVPILFPSGPGMLAFLCRVPELTEPQFPYIAPPAAQPTRHKSIKAGTASGPSTAIKNELRSTAEIEIIRWMNGTQSTSNRASRMRWGPIIAAALVSVLLACIACTADSELGAKDPKDAYYNLMVRGWLQGKTSLSMEAPAGLAGLPNPYDPKANAQYRGTLFYGPRIHDLSYFNGKLYAYFSAVPAVLAFLPFHLLTGQWLSHQQACLCFCLAGFYCAVALTWSLRNRLFERVGDGALSTAVLALGFLSLSPLLMQRPDVWEVPTGCAQASWILALLSVWWSLCRPRADWISALMAGVSAALAAGSRPASSLCGIILLIPAYRILSASGERTTARKIGSMAALALPPMAIGGALLAFNHARFGEWLEFGQKYQLNVDAVRHTTSENFGLSYLAYNLRLYSLNYRGWSTHFPFVRGMVFPPAPPGYGVGDFPVGIIPQLPAALFAVALGVAWRSVPQIRRREYFWVVGLIAGAGLAVAFPLLMYFTACLRYEFEFAMYVAILAAVGYLGLEATSSGSARLLARAAWGTTLAASIAISLLMTVSLRALTLTVHGRIDLSRGNLTEAAGHIRTALSLQPNLVTARALLGTVHIQERDFREAAGDFARALQDDPDSAVLLSNYGYCLLQLGREEEAISALARAVAIDPNSSQTAELLKVARQRETNRANAGSR